MLKPSRRSILLSRASDCRYRKTRGLLRHPDGVMSTTSQWHRVLRGNALLAFISGMALLYIRLGGGLFNIFPSKPAYALRTDRHCHGE